MSRIITALLIVLVTMPAYAQGMSGGKMHHAREQNGEEPKKKPDDKGYNSSLAKCQTKNTTLGKAFANFPAARDARQ
jgi:hypothetical protein